MLNCNNCSLCTSANADIEGRTCSQGKDMNQGTLIVDFDRTVTRDCCVPDFWMTVQQDAELSDLFANEPPHADLFDTFTCTRFLEKYLLNKDELLVAVPA